MKVFTVFLPSRSLCQNIIDEIKPGDVGEEQDAIKDPQLYAVQESDTTMMLIAS